jgi:hypothetical protein
MSFLHSKTANCYGDEWYLLWNLLYLALVFAFIQTRGGGMAGMWWAEFDIVTCIKLSALSSFPCLSLWTVAHSSVCTCVRDVWSSVPPLILHPQWLRQEMVSAVGLLVYICLHSWDANWLRLIRYIYTHTHTHTHTHIYIYIYIYVVWQFNSRNCPVEAKFAYLYSSGCGRFRNTLLVKICTSWDGAASAENSLENRFTE